MLSTSSLQLGYGRSVVLECPALEVKSGESCLITGPSGSGKTTLLYAIAGLIRPLSGHIIIDGADITTMSESKRDRFRGSNIGMIFQTLHLVKHLKVLDNLLLASYMAGFTVEAGRAEEVLAELGILDKKNAFPENLSQGQAQRVAIARAVLHNPPMILADEPTSSLDDAACESVITLIKNVASASNAALVISTHDSRLKPHFSRSLTVGASA